MKTVGMIVEYNPLHYGHVFHYEQSLKKANADAVIAIMSGHYLQRGEPAIVNKWARTEMALHMGADVVIELPIAYASQPAEWFAFGAVSALDATGVVDSLCFGSESGDIQWLQLLAKKLHNEPASFQQLLKQELKLGNNYPTAYSNAVQAFISVNEQLSQSADQQLDQPNNILGLHYLIALERLQSQMIPLTITRQKAQYHQKDISDIQIASATAIRNLIMNQQAMHEIQPYIPAFTYELLQREWGAGRAPMHWELFTGPLYHQLLNSKLNELREIYEVNEGLENRIKQILPLLHASQFGSVGGLLERLKTKRYTRTKLQRTLLRILLQHKKEELSPSILAQGVPYLRVLGFSDKGRKLLKTMKSTAKVPVITKASKAEYDMLNMDIRATSIYASAYAQPSQEECFRDYYQAPIYLEGSLDK